MLNKHAPLKTKQLRIPHTQPWFYNRIKSEIILRCKKEQKWRQDPIEYNYWAFYHQWRHVANIIKTAKREQYTTIIRENKDNIKNLYSIANKLLLYKEPLPLPDAADHKELATTFSSLFDEKIKKIMEILHLAYPSDIYEKYIESQPITTHSLTHFNSLNLMEVKDIIQNSVTKSCEQDPLPTSLVESHLDTLLPNFMEIINASITTGAFSDSLKGALLWPLLKKIDLELILPNYRPVWTFQTFYKWLKKQWACN